ncbi:MAG: DUF3667 domain-containing protein [Prevotella sp.]|nr:DUF3667 domain-containing protein [Prevotella sp.]
MDIKEQYRRFRRWQVAPMVYEDKLHEPCRCANCGHDVTTEYCPVCGQRSGVGRITWHTVRQGVMLLWGMDSRSMPYSLWQLLWRPGYFIHDYLSGHRQVSFPPVKMLFIIAFFVVLLDYFIGSSTPETSTTAIDTTNFWGIIEHFLETNVGWAVLLYNSLFILPTWMLFRFSPRYEHHTLPEGFFIQVFISNLMLLLTLISGVVNLISEPLSDWLFIFVPCYYVITYHQLFGYGWWGTIWRVTGCLLAVLLVVICFIVVWKFYFSSNASTIQANHNRFIAPISIVMLLALCALVLGGGYLIGKKKR